MLQTKLGLRAAEARRHVKVQACWETLSTGQSTSLCFGNKNKYLVFLSPSKNGRGMKDLHLATLQQNRSTTSTATTSLELWCSHTLRINNLNRVVRRKIAVLIPITNSQFWRVAVSCSKVESGWARWRVRAITQSGAVRHSPGCRLAGQGSRTVPEGRLAAVGKAAAEGMLAGQEWRLPGCKASGRIWTLDQLQEERQYGGEWQKSEINHKHKGKFSQHSSSDRGCLSLHNRS